MSFVLARGAVIPKDSSAFVRRQRRRKILRILLLTLLLFVLMVGGTILYYMKRVSGLDAHLFSFYLRAQEQSTTLVSKDSLTQSQEQKSDEVHLYVAQHRLRTSYDQIPIHLQNAIVAIEDQRFFRHHGVDLQRTLGATTRFLTGRSSYGGSTITQQLIKNVTGDAEVSPRRKIKEIALAWRIERQFTKEELLTMYLNTVYLSGHCYGVQSAAQTYFGKDVSELSLQECASLAAIVQSPARWDPLRHPEAHLTRRNLVLSKMKELGMITDAEYQQGVGSPLQTVESVAVQSEEPAQSWYTETVLDEGVALLASLYSIPTEQARRLLYTGGFTIVTAKDSKVQSTLEQLYQREGTFPKVDDSLIQPQSACVVLDPKTGAILGIVGARGQKTQNRILNYATDTLRPPGSAIKPLSVYAPAMQAGLISYASVYDDTPVNFTVSAQGWPSNYPVGYRGLTPIWDAVSRSVNTVAVKVLQDYGVENAFSFLQNRLHLSSLVTQKKTKDGRILTDMALAPLALGQLTNGVSVLELTAGYTIFDCGEYHAPFSIWELRDSAGNVLFSREPKGEQVLSVGNAQSMTQMLKEVTTNGTASSLNLAKRMDTAGKTGTTTEDCDRWFVGYTQQYLCGVWFGYATPQPLHGFSEVRSPALSVWDQVMMRLEEDSLSAGVPKPFDTSHLVRTQVCRDSGCTLSTACLQDPRGNRAHSAYFTVEQLPHTVCSCHISVPYDTEKGGVCLGGCTHTKTVGLITVPNRDFPKQVCIADAQYVYRPIGAKNPSPDPNQPFFATALEKGHYAGISAGGIQYNRACYEDWYLWQFSEDWEMTYPEEELFF